MNNCQIDVSCCHIYNVQHALADPRKQKETRSGGPRMDAISTWFIYSYTWPEDERLHKRDDVGTHSESLCQCASTRPRLAPCLSSTLKESEKILVVHWALSCPNTILNVLTGELRLVFLSFFFHFFAGYLLLGKHLQTLPLSVLSDYRLSIDASYYLQLLMDNPPSREPLLAASGGLPLALTQRIESDLRALEKLRIKPVFVFPGLLPNELEATSSLRTRRGMQRQT
jgi:XPG N-terminal domain